MSSIVPTIIPPNMPNQSCLIQIYAASGKQNNSFTLVDHASAFNRALRKLIRLSAIAPPLLGGHTLLPTASVESTTEWCVEWETWVGGLLRALQDAKEQGDHLEIPHNMVQAIAMAEVAYTNLEGRAEVERMRELRSDRSRTGMQ
ncbi:hypothetical protein BDN67DRAFT_984068 [Paxillus ammoniavirescens]|nr:hypothetical protein BDN67DRAFT_984068 [Paxillus ammoniavirescens]